MSSPSSQCDVIRNQTWFSRYDVITLWRHQKSNLLRSHRVTPLWIRNKKYFSNFIMSSSSSLCDVIRNQTWFFSYDAITMWLHQKSNLLRSYRVTLRWTRNKKYFSNFMTSSLCDVIKNQTCSDHIEWPLVGFVIKNTFQILWRHHSVTSSKNKLAPIISSDPFLDS